MKKRLVKKSWCFAIILLFVGASFLPSVMSETQKTSTFMTMQNTWIVDDEGDGDFITIQDAIDAASDGDIICVYSGTYTENVIVYKELKLIGIDEEYEAGDDTGKPIVDGNNLGNVFEINHSDVTIDGFIIQNSGPLDGKAIFIIYSENIKILNNNIENNNHGIYLFEKGIGSRISGNNVIYNFWGIWLNGASGITTEDNYVEHNSKFGIVLEGCYQISVNHNEVRDNHIGIGVFRSRQCDITSNNFITNGDGGLDHAYCENCRNNWNGNYYDPAQGVCKVLKRIYIIGVFLQPNSIPWLIIPSIPQIDFNRVDSPYDIS